METAAAAHPECEALKTISEKTMAAIVDNYTKKGAKDFTKILFRAESIVKSVRYLKADSEARVNIATADFINKLPDQRKRCPEVFNQIISTH